MTKINPKKVLKSFDHVLQHKVGKNHANDHDVFKYVFTMGLKITNQLQQ